MCDEERVFCSTCNADLPTNYCEPDFIETPCPACGSTKRLVEIISEEHYDRPIREESRSRLFQQGYKKPILEEISRDDWSRSRGRWVQLDRTIDRLNDRYTERVIDPESEEVIHHCDEPLSQHQGHGSARKQPTPPAN
jgi:hypothetical protein